MLPDVNAKLSTKGLKTGRDKLFSILKRHDLLIEKKKRYQRTTYSNHEYVVAPNRIKDLKVESPNQVLVSDITYINLMRGHAYLFLTTDLYSRKILGFHLSMDLGHHSALLALNMALDSIPYATGVIHHSDRGCQYCCHEFIYFLKSFGMIPSMTAENHCYENAHAERVNGILKLDLNLDSVFESFKDAKKSVEQAIHIYNYKRRHWSLGLQTPDSFYKKAA